MIKSKIFTITISCLILIETIITTKASDQLQNNLPARIRALSQLYRNNMENPIITVQQPSEPIDQNKIIMAAFSSIMFNNGGVKFNGEPVNDSNRIDCAKALI